MQTAAAGAVLAERNRIAAIIALPEAKGREDYATKLAMTTDLSVDQVKAKLAAETSALWDGVLTSHGMKLGANAASDTASASPWDGVMRQKGFAVGAGA
jgi:hypothetical protein